jgi:imidazole glycerol-phosphate synthase subunit HisH
VSTMISILDYGLGNLASVRNALNHLGIKNSIINKPSEVKNCGRLILPGVGAFASAMENLHSAGLTDAIIEHASVRRRPILGICLGMQLLLDQSYEDGIHAGLGLLRGQVKPLSDVCSPLVVPHVGWNSVTPTKQTGLLNPNYPESSFYFIHNYYCKLDDVEQVVGTSSYGIEFHSMVESDNVYGCQFHPEKSQKRGLELLNNFSAI